MFGSMKGLNWLGVGAASVVLTGLMPSQGSAQEAGTLPEKFGVDLAHSYVGFTVGFMKMNRVRGEFTSWTGTLMYNEEDMARSSISVVINTESIATRNSMRDNDLKTEKFFDTENHPRITFQSAWVEEGSDGQMIAHGPLTIRGITTDVEIPFVRIHETQADAWGHQRVDFAGAVTVNRWDYDIDGGSFWGAKVISDSVQIEMNVSATQTNYDSYNYGDPEAEKQPIGPVLETMAMEEGGAAALAHYTEISASEDGKWDVGGRQVWLASVKLLGHGYSNEAITLLEEMIDGLEDRRAVAGLTVLADAYIAEGRTADALEAARRISAVNPYNTNALELVRWLEGHPTETTLAG